MESPEKLEKGKGKIAAQDDVMEEDDDESEEDEEVSSIRTIEYDRIANDTKQGEADGTHRPKRQ